MPASSKPRFFPSEGEFTFWLANLMEASEDFTHVAVDKHIRDQNEGRLGVVDIMAKRSNSGRSQTVIIECKNLSTLYGRTVDQSIAQLKKFGGADAGSQLVIALPGNMPDLDKARCEGIGIDVWDLGFIVKTFERQLKEQHPWIFNVVEDDRSERRHSPEELIRDLRACKAGREHWSVYQKLIGTIVQHVFCPPLQPPLEEVPDESGTNRRDFILANFATEGLWSFIRSRYQADYVVIDAKNYSKRIGKKEIVQIGNYLKPFGAGMFGMIFSRHGGDASARITARELWSHSSKLIVIFDDQKCEALLKAAMSGDAASVLEKEIQDFRLSM